MSPSPPTANDVVPYLIVTDAAAAIDFCVAALGAIEDHRLTMPDGKIGHAELRLGDRRVYLADEFPGEGQVAPQAGTPSPVVIVVHVDDAEAAADRASGAGATIVWDEMAEVFGTRSAFFSDPFGHRWNIQQQVRAMTPDQMQRAIDDAYAPPQPQPKPAP